MCRMLILVVVLSVVWVSGSCTALGKIFTHDRGAEVRKQARLDDNEMVEFLRRAMEGFKENATTYTGYYFLDMVFEVIKSLCIFLLTLMAPVDVDGSSGHLANSNDTAGLVDNTI